MIRRRREGNHRANKVDSGQDVNFDDRDMGTDRHTQEDQPIGPNTLMFYLEPLSNYIQRAGLENGIF